MARFTFGGEAVHVPVQEVSAAGVTVYGPAPGIGTIPLYDVDGALVTQFYLKDVGTGEFDNAVSSISTLTDGFLPVFQVEGHSVLLDEAGKAIVSWEGTGSGSTGLPAGTEGQFVSYDAGGNPIAVDAPTSGGGYNPDDFAADFAEHASEYLPQNLYRAAAVLDPEDPIPTLDRGSLIFRRIAATVGTPTVTELASGGSTTNGTSASTASVTPVAGKLHLAYVVTANPTSGGIAAPLPSGAVTGAGLTWTKVADVSSTDNVTHSGLFVGTGTPSAGAITISPGASVEGFAWRIIDVANVETELVQVATAQPSASDTNPGVTLSGVNSANMVMGFIVQQNSNALTAATGFTEISPQTGISDPAVYHAAEYKLTGQNNVNWTGSGTVKRAAIAIELAPA